ncbi:hypothetical protein FSP39_009133 [Pinctada imbricata]|uniref:CCHC-type domain-containing protein n=1 Tax=Pinctada imbricata TaxID=66713 RepID=A0AA88XQR1_PINIB|nr:hypothetical protein FSP39_009133 [Pinctada imbricata]
MEDSVESSEEKADIQSKAEYKGKAELQDKAKNQDSVDSQCKADTQGKEDAQGKEDTQGKTCSQGQKDSQAPKQFPRAKYFCCICEWHLDKLSDCKRHIRDKKHEKRKQGKVKSTVDVHQLPMNEAVVASTKDADKMPDNAKKKGDGKDKGTTKLSVEKKKGKKEEKGNKKSTPERAVDNKGKDKKANSVNDSSNLERNATLKKEMKSDLDDTFEEERSILDMSEDTPAELVRKALEREKIFPLKKKSIRFPRAKYFCRLCDYHMDMVEDCKKHVKDSRHRRRNEVSLINQKLLSMPLPCQKQIRSLDSMVQDLYREHGMTEEDLLHRAEIVQTLISVIRKEEVLNDTQLKLYGSSLTGMGMKCSDVNMDLGVKTKNGHAKALTHMYKVLRESDEYCEVQSDFSAKVPCIYFTDVTYRYKCQMTVGSDLACLTSKLLQMYTQCDPRVKPLGLSLRLWARTCKIDRQDEGTVPPYCTSLMVIHYLQSCKPPVLPCIYGSLEEGELKPSKTPLSDRVDFDVIQEKVRGWKSRNKECLGALWLGMLKYYCLTFEHQNHIVTIREVSQSRADRKWNTKRLAVEDPFNTKRNVAKSIKSFEIFEYVWDCVRQSYYYFGLPSNYDNLTRQQRNELMIRYKIKAMQAKSEESGKSEKVDNEHTENQSHVEEGQGSSGTFQKETTKSNLHDSDKTKSSSDSNSHSEGLSQRENTPDSTCEKNVATSEGNDKCYQDVDKGEANTVCDNCDKEQTLYNDSRTIGEGSGSTLLSQRTDTEDALHVFAKTIVDNVISYALCVMRESVQKSTTEDNSSVIVNGSAKVDSVRNESKEISDHEDTVEDTPRSPHEGNPNLEYQYEFTQNTLSDGKGPSVICVVCEKEGHLKSNCPEETLPELKPLPPMTKQHLQFLNSVIKQVPKDFGLTQWEIKEREKIREELEEFLRELYPHARLHLFGSSHNGFGFRHSDLDLCCTFDDKPGENYSEEDPVLHIEEITKKLKTHKGLYNVIPITTAKVPIVKFRHRRSQLEGDISMYNLLALYNTRMVSLYASLDNRVQTLGYAVKVFAKICDIGDASRGSLSSYAYILMLLYYLQQCNPPVIPVLQEIHPVKEKPERIIDGWNTWYYDDAQSLPSVWPSWGKNKQSVGELWAGFFRFYTESFNQNDHVVCIRQLEPLTRFEKLWNGKCIAIEDPFDLAHNLGGGLSRRMNHFIQQTFVYGRYLYNNPISEVPAAFNTIADYFFDKEQLTAGKPPNDRCCRVCNKIGHIAKECPVVLNRKEREERERKKKEEMKKQRESDMNSEEVNCNRRGQSREKNSDARNSHNDRRESNTRYNREDHRGSPRQGKEEYRNNTRQGREDYGGQRQGREDYGGQRQGREDYGGQRQGREDYGGQRQGREDYGGQRQGRVAPYYNNTDMDRYHGDRHQMDYYGNSNQQDRHPRDIRRTLSESSDHEQERVMNSSMYFYNNQQYQRSSSMPGSLGQGHMSSSSSRFSSGNYPQVSQYQQQYHHGNMSPSPNRHHHGNMASSPNRHQLPNSYPVPQHLGRQGCPPKPSGYGGSHDQVPSQAEAESGHPWIQQLSHLFMANSLPKTTQVYNNTNSIPYATNVPHSMVFGNFYAPYNCHLVTEGQQGPIAASANTAMPAESMSPLQSQGSRPDGRSHVKQGILRDSPLRHNTGRTIQNEYYMGNMGGSRDYTPKGQQQYQSNRRR